MHASTNIHAARTVSADAMDCARDTPRAFTNLQITIKCDGGSFTANLIGLSPDYARRLAAAIDAVPVDIQSVEAA